MATVSVNSDLIKRLVMDNGGVGKVSEDLGFHKTWLFKVIDTVEGPPLVQRHLLPTSGWMRAR